MGMSAASGAKGSGRRGRRGRRHGAIAEINMTPFIDVMLVLLIIFMVAAPLATVDVKVDLPVSNAPSAPKPEAPAAPTLKDSTPIRRDGVALTNKRDAIVVLEKEEKAAASEANVADTALHDLKHALGVCPTCNQSFPEQAHV